MSLGSVAILRLNFKLACQFTSQFHYGGHLRPIGIMTAQKHLSSAPRSAVPDCMGKARASLSSIHSCPQGWRSNYGFKS